MLGTAGINSDVNSIAATAAIPALLVLVPASVGIALVLARRDDDRSAFEWFAGLSTVALILAVTVFRGDGPTGLTVRYLADWGGVSSLSRDPLASSQFLLNVMLFVPAGVVWTWLTGRPVTTWAALVVGSFTIECGQAVTGAGVNDVVDLVSNSIGALVGVGVGFALVSVFQDRVATISPQQRTAILGVVLVVAASVTIGWFTGASRRQSDMRTAVEERFTGVDVTEIRGRIEDDFEEAFTTLRGVRPEGGSFEDRVEMRYSATFFSLHRCVFVTWTIGLPSFRDASGDDCTRFISS